MPKLRWSAPTAWADAFGSTNLDALAANSVKISTTTIDTRATREFGIMFEFTTTSTMSPTGAADVVVMLLPVSSDGTNYVDGEDGTTVANQPVFVNVPHEVLGLRIKATSAQRVISQMIPVPPGLYKAALLNRSGVPLPATGNMVKYSLVSQETA